VARRIDYYDDPDAPTVNSMVASVNVVVTNAAGEVLLIRRSDNDNWALPGGAIDLGESMVQAAVRETREETGIDCEVTGLVGIYTDPRRPGHRRRADTQRGEQRGPVDPSCRARRVLDGSVDAAADRALPRGTGYAIPRLSGPVAGLSGGRRP
jgi:8-oxo-dGTP pyrophosphatase MutT (NUDIX family)